ncbi:MAG TPA: molybdopterin cofactor-binding domain-containing protein [Burkholderiales bacterium]|nr:molybdopterin cofactor-binding domain-containing protein [Burkholderiales bacterium]
MNVTSISRRDFLKSSGALVVSIGVPASVASALADAATASGKPPLVPTELDSWIAVLPDGRVTAFFGKVDMGQGVDVAIAQIVAEELDVAFDKVSVVMGDTQLTCNQGGASGSTGIQLGGMALRNAAAEARRVLVERAAKRLDVSVSDLAVEDGLVHVPGYPYQRVTYGELVGGQYFHHQLEWNKKYGNPLEIKGVAQPKPASAHKVVGKAHPIKVISEKVMGTAQYVSDVRLEGMLHARVVRPPTAGCGPLSVDERSIADIPGARVVREKDFIAVVAEREWDAVRAAEALKVSWTPPCMPFPEMAALHDHIRKAPVTARGTPLNRGDVDAALKSAHRMVEAEYEWPLQSHASMGPSCAVADMNGDNPRLWTGSQKPHYGRMGAAKLTGVPLEKLHAIWMLGPGSYGRSDAGDAALDAAMVSKLTGRPVRLQYMRPDAIAWDPKGPAAVYRGRAGLDANGNVVAYDFFGKGFSRQDVIQLEGDPKDTLAGQLTGWKPKGNDIFAVPTESYAFANKRLSWATIPPLLERASPLRTGHLRDPLGAETHFASESFIDEIAHAAGADPVAFRLRYASNPRHVAALTAAAEKAGWSARAYPSAERGKGDVMAGRGVSLTERNGTVVAVIAEVEVDRRSGRVWARKFTVAHDCGQIINPGTLRNVIEGNVLQATSRTLFEEVRFDRDRVLSEDWASYTILDIADAPETIDIVLIDRPEVAPSGAGEPSTRTVPAAIANAIYDATGVRMRKAPISPQRVKEALGRTASA